MIRRLAIAAGVFCLIFALVSVFLSPQVARGLAFYLGLPYVLIAANWAGRVSGGGGSDDDYSHQGCPDINPTTGSPMAPGGGLDVGGTAWGAPPDDHWRQ